MHASSLSLSLPLRQTKSKPLSLLPSSMLVITFNEKQTHDSHCQILSCLGRPVAFSHHLNTSLFSTALLERMVLFYRTAHKKIYGANCNRLVSYILEIKTRKMVIHHETRDTRLFQVSEPVTAQPTPPHGYT